MNLWVKSLRQLAVLAVASFFFSCEDEASLIGFKDPKTKFNVRYIEIPISSSVVLIDSLATDNKPDVVDGNVVSSVFSRNTAVLAGQYQDLTLGNVRAEPFLGFVFPYTTKLDASSVYDSVKLDVQFNHYGYGFNTETDFKFSVHEITDDSLDRRLTTRYYSSTPPRFFNPTQLGEISVNNIKYYDLRKQYVKATTQQDTLLASVRLDDSFGQRLFNFSKTDTIQKSFLYNFKGLTIQPVQGSGILGISASSVSLTRVTLYYHYTNTTGSVVNAVRQFGFGGWITKYADPNYTSISVDREASVLAPINDFYQSYEVPSGLRVIQSGSPVITKLDLTNFYEDFADTVENIIVNSAELIIEGVESPAGLSAHSVLTYKIMKGDKFANSLVAADSTGLNSYLRSGKIVPDVKHYLVRNENPATESSAALIGYDSAKQKFSGFMTLFTQGLFANKNKQGQINPDRIRYLALYPGNPLPSASVNRTFFNAGNVKLRIYYTKPTERNP